VRFTPIPNEKAFMAQFPDNRRYIIKGMTIEYYYKMVREGITHAMKLEWVDEDFGIGMSGKLSPPDRS